MKSVILSRLAAPLACCLLAATAMPASAAATLIAQADAPPAHPASATLKKKDAMFVMDAASAGEFEIEASKLADERSTNPKIKAFAEHMVEEHTKNGETLKTLASSKGLTVSSALEKADQEKLTKLKTKKAGKDFDKAYCSVMLTSHKSAVGRYEGAKEDVIDSDLRSYIVTSLPTLKDHTEMAKTLNKG